MAQINWNGLFDADFNSYEYSNSVSQAQNQLLNQICNTSSSSIQQAPPSYTIKMHHLSDIINVYGDLAVKCMTQDYSPGDPLSITIECIMDDPKYSTLLNQINKEQENDFKKENNKMNNNMSNNSMFDSFKVRYGYFDWNSIYRRIDDDYGKTCQSVLQFDIDKTLMITHYNPEQFILDTDKLTRFDDCYVSNSRYSEEVEVWHS